MALDEPRRHTFDLSSPDFATCKFAYLPVPAADTEIICDTSLDAPRPFVLMTHRRVVFDTLHHLAHPGLKATVKLISARFFRPNMPGRVSYQKSKMHKHISLEHSAPKTLGSAMSILIWLDHVHIDLVGPWHPDLYRLFYTVA